MKKWSLKQFLTLTIATFALAASSFAADATPSRTIKIGVVDFKKCVEQSKLGKQEEASFEAMKKQMEAVVGEKEKTLTEMANKLNDPDQLDLMSPEAETELKRKFRALSQEMQQIQAQFYQTLQQANFKVIQKLSEVVTTASEKVAKDLSLDLVVNDETCFFAASPLDITSQVVKQMDSTFEQDAKQTPTAALDTKK